MIACVAFIDVHAKVFPVKLESISACAFVRAWSIRALLVLSVAWIVKTLVDISAPLRINRLVTIVAIARECTKLINTNGNFFIAPVTSVQAFVLILAIKAVAREAGVASASVSDWSIVASCIF